MRIGPLKLGHLGEQEPLGDLGIAQDVDAARVITRKAPGSRSVWPWGLRHGLPLGVCSPPTCDIRLEARFRQASPQ